mmetsp:Transcript_11812/g.33697  ORF Transcript_11812/g.33697 Transcript_11812/m.33697 type:complete len:300 (-) Transcript_11812:273-1172(-)
MIAPPRPQARAVDMAALPPSAPTAPYEKCPPTAARGSRMPRMMTSAATLAATAGPRASLAADAMPAEARVSSRAKMGPARGMPIKAVSEPAAPAYAMMPSTSDPEPSFSSSLLHHFRAKAAPTRPPAHTMGASGPTLNPKVLVTRERRRRLGRAGRRLGREVGRLPERLETNSATMYAGLRPAESSPITSPPAAMVAAMYAPPPRATPLAASRAGTCSHTPRTVRSRTFPYAKPMAAVAAPTATAPRKMSCSPLSSLGAAAAETVIGRGRAAPPPPPPPRTRGQQGRGRATRLFLAASG